MATTRWRAAGSAPSGATWRCPWPAPRSPSAAARSAPPGPARRRLRRGPADIARVRAAKSHNAQEHFFSTLHIGPIWLALFSELTTPQLRRLCVSTELKDRLDAYLRKEGGVTWRRASRCPCCATWSTQGRHSGAGSRWRAQRSGWRRGRTTSARARRCSCGQRACGSWVRRAW